MSRRAEVERMLKPGFADNLIALGPSDKPPTRVSRKAEDAAAELEA
jgi:hypothetical protein